MNKQSTTLQPSPYAERLIARSEQLAKTQAERKARKPARKTDPPSASKTAAVASLIEKLVPAEIEILLKIEERGAQRFGLGAAICTEGRSCPRAILLALNRAYHPLLRRALLGSDGVALRYFAALLLSTYLNYNRQNAVLGALIQKLKVELGASQNPGWRPSHLALADIVCLSKPFDNFDSLPIYGAEAQLGEIYLLGTYTLEVSAAAAAEAWQRSGQRRQEQRAAKGGAL